MRVMVLVKASKNSEAGVMPSEEMMVAMGRFNEELVQAGILVDGDGLEPSRDGKRIRFADGKTTVVDGPFPNTSELVAGYWIWEVKSMDEAVEWARRCPPPMPGEVSELEIRPFLESAAIAIYLADRYGLGRLAPTPDDPRRGTYLRWILFAPSVIEPSMMAKAGGWQVPERTAGWGSYESMLEAMQSASKNGPYLLGDTFSMADVVFGGTIRVG